MLRTLAILLFLSLSAASFKATAQSQMCIGRSYAMTEVRPNFWVSKEIYVSEDSNLNTYIQFGMGRNMPRCALSHEDTKKFALILAECNQLGKEARRTRQNANRELGVLGNKISLIFSSTRNGGSINLIILATDFANPSISGKFYINPTQIRHMLWLLKDEKLAYRKL